MVCTCGPLLKPNVRLHEQSKGSLALFTVVKQVRDHFFCNNQGVLIHTLDKPSLSARVTCWASYILAEDQELSGLESMREQVMSGAADNDGLHLAGVLAT